MSVKDRFPSLYNTYERDNDGRPADSPDGGLKVLGTRAPSPVEQVKATLSTFGIPVTDSQASQVVSDLDERSRLVDGEVPPSREPESSKTTEAKPPVPVAPPPPAAPKGK